MNLTAHNLDGRVAIRMPEWSSVDPQTPEVGDLLRGLSFDSHPSASRKAAEMARYGVVEVTERRAGLAITTRSYIGRLRLGPLELTIIPKINWSRWLVLVSFALRLRSVLRGDRVDATRHDEAALRDLLFLELVAEGRDLVSRGLHREYISRRASLASPRGRIDFRRIASTAGVVGAQLPSRFSRRSDDSSLNRTLLAAMRYAAANANDRRLRAEAARLARDLDRTVARSPLNRELLRQAQASVDRRTRRYLPALTLVELLLDGETISLDEREDRRAVEVPGFAINMNMIWQRLLGRVLAEWLEGYRLQEEARLRHVFRRNEAYPYRGRTPTPRPDFAVNQGGRLTSYLDAKYRDLWARPLPREMLYQLSLYAVAQGGGIVTILYPTDSVEAREQRIDLQDPLGGGRRATVAIRPVKLFELEALITAPRGETTRSRRSEFAQELVRRE